MNAPLGNKLWLLMIVTGLIVGQAREVAASLELPTGSLGSAMAASCRETTRSTDKSQDARRLRQGNQDKSPLLAMPGEGAPSSSAAGSSGTGNGADRSQLICPPMYLNSQLLYAGYPVNSHVSCLVRRRKAYCGRRVTSWRESSVS